MRHSLMVARFRITAATRLSALFLCLALGAPCMRATNPAPDLSGDYEFLAPENTLGLLEEEGKLKGYIDVIQGEDESDTVLSYPITLGTRQGDHVEFKTGKIHERYYRFTGDVERGGGRSGADPDFLRLVGTVEIVSVDSASGQERTERRRATFKWKGKSNSSGE